MDRAYSHLPLHCIIPLGSGMYLQYLKTLLKDTFNCRISETMNSEDISAGSACISHLLLGKRLALDSCLLSNNIICIPNPQQQSSLKDQFYENSPSSHQSPLPYVITCSKEYCDQRARIRWTFSDRDQVEKAKECR